MLDLRAAARMLAVSRGSAGPALAAADFLAAGLAAAGFFAAEGLAAGFFLAAPLLATGHRHHLGNTQPAARGRPGRLNLAGRLPDGLVGAAAVDSASGEVEGSAAAGSSPAPPPSVFLAAAKISATDIFFLSAITPQRYRHSRSWNGYR